MSKVFVITATGQYNDTWLERIYTSLDSVKEYLLMNYRYWWENRDDIDTEEFNESIQSIENLSSSDLIDSSFYVHLYHRGVELNVDLVELDEAPDII